MDDTLEKDSNFPFTKNKGMKIKESAKVIPKRSRYSNDLKGKKTQQSSKKDEAKLLRKLLKESQKAKKKEPTK